MLDEPLSPPAPPPVPAGLGCADAGLANAPIASASAPACTARKIVRSMVVSSRRSSCRPQLQRASLRPVPPLRLDLASCRLRLRGNDGFTSSARTTEVRYLPWRYQATDTVIYLSHPR